MTGRMHGEDELKVRDCEKNECPSLETQLPQRRLMVRSWKKQMARTPRGRAAGVPYRAPLNRIRAKSLEPVRSKPARERCEIS
jgi:hypothetical protein